MENYNKKLDELLKKVDKYKYDDDMDYIYKDISEIRENIFLGSLSGLENKKHAQELGITHCVNCTGDVAFPKHDLIKPQNMFRFNIAEQRSSMYGSQQEQKTKHDKVQQMLSWVYNAISKGGKVMFYCIAGCHRAPGTCQLFLMFLSYLKDDPIEPVVAFVETQSKRKQAEFCYENYLLSLKPFLKSNSKNIANMQALKQIINK